MRKCNTILFSLLFCFYAAGTQAQLAYTAKLDSVKESGFYKIQIIPALTSHLNADLSDLRITDDKSQFVPYILRPYQAPLKDKYAPLDILNNSLDKKGNSIVIAENKSTTSIDNLLLFNASTAVSRHVSLSGSDDRKNWYIINDSLLFSSSHQSRLNNLVNMIKYDSYLQSVSFPTCNYRYFKLIVFNQKTDPIRIIGVGIYRLDTTRVSANSPYYIENPSMNFTKKDSIKNTYLYMDNPDRLIMQEMTFHITNPKFFDRVIIIEALRDDSVSRDESPYNYLTEHTLSSSDSSLIGFHSTKAKKILIAILNRDNPPLQIENVHTYMANTYAIAYLEKSKQYHILAGDANAAKPEYDLSHFTDSLPANMPSLKYGNITQIHKNGLTITKKNTGNQWLWVTIISGITILGYFTVKLVKDMKKI